MAKRKSRPTTKTRGAFESERCGWHACPYMGMRQWLDKGEVCGECSVEDDSGD